MKMKLAQVLFGLAGLCLAMAVQAKPVADAIRVEGAYARAVPPGQTNSAAFMVLHNEGATAHALVAAKSPVAKLVELHTHALVDGMMRMRPVERIALPAGQKVQLQPGGLHLMLIGLDHTLTPEEQVPLTLIYEDGSRQSIQMPVRRAEAMMMPSHTMMHPRK
jgi:copper(I)-binding protein